MPSGLWDVTEYEKLPAYDGATWEQATAGATGVFCCHQQNDRLCAGWVAVHDMEESLALRLAAAAGKINEADLDVIFDYQTDVPLFASGAEAAAHGLRNIAAPDPAALRTIQRLRRKLAKMSE